MFVPLLLTAAFSQSIAEGGPAAKPLDPLDGDARSKAMVAGISRFLDRKTAEISADRRKRWAGMVKPDFKEAESLRRKLRFALGTTDAVKRRPPDLELAATTYESSKRAETDKFTADAVKWRALLNVRGEGLLLRPKTPTNVCVVAIPDSQQTPEMICGLSKGLPPESQFARRLANAGATVLVPCLVNVNDEFSGNHEIGRLTKQPHREWIYRQSYELGRHVLGYEVEKALAAVDYFDLGSDGVQRAYVVGHGEGGLIAMYAAAIEPRVAGAYVGGCFQDRSSLWSQPIWRNVFGLLKDFDDAEVAALIFPRPLFVDHVSLEPPNHGAWRSKPSETPGVIATPSEESFFKATKQAAKYAEAMNAQGKTISASFSTTSDDAKTRPDRQRLCPGLERFGEAIGLKIDRRVPPLEPFEFFEDVQERVVADLTEAVQREYRESERVRRDLWKGYFRGGLSGPKLKRASAETRKSLWQELDPAKVQADKWHEACNGLREKFRKEVIGEFDDKKLPPNPRARKLKETPDWVMHEVVLDVWPEVSAWGYLLLPKNIKEGEKRPVVVCQHGLEGLPEDCVADDPKHPGFGPYQAFAARLADRGFVVFAPHNPYRGGDAFRVLQRKANPLGRSLFSIIVAQHEVITEWLARQPFVDPSRIGFYGLSYGGKTAMRAPALVDRYCLSICSADFNDWIRKNVVVDDPHSYMFTGEYEMPEFDLGRTFNYAEMAALIAPRPFMVERGHHDGVAPDEWVAYEYAKVRRLYAELRIPERTEIEFFLGPHRIHGVGTYEFLHRHLKWPKPEPRK
jgi:dienelactone hydrolase